MASLILGGQPNPVYLLNLVRVSPSYRPDLCIIHHSSRKEWASCANDKTIRSRIKRLLPIFLFYWIRYIGKFRINTDHPNVAAKSPASRSYRINYFISEIILSCHNSFLCQLLFLTLCGLIFVDIRHSFFLISKAKRPLLGQTLSYNSSSAHECPPISVIPYTFAVTNINVSLLSVLFSYYIIANKPTFGFWGNRGSKSQVLYS